MVFHIRVKFVEKYLKTVFNLQSKHKYMYIAGTVIFNVQRAITQNVVMPGL